MHEFRPNKWWVGNLGCVSTVDLLYTSECTQFLGKGIFSIQLWTGSVNSMFLFETKWYVTVIYRIVSNKRSPSNKRPLTYFQIKLGKMPKFLYGVSL